MVWLRNRLYDTGVFSSIEFMVPVISVGNLSVGGTGKTPHVEYLIKLLQYRFQAATMSRGYKRRTQGFLLADENTNALRIGDEPMQYHMKFPDLVVSVAEERITGIPRLLQQRPNVDVVLLDDAYQHRSVKPGVNILITDFAKPFYKDHILPLGTLRESRKAYKRANIIVVSKCPNNLSSHQASEIEKKIAPKQDQKIFFSKIDYQQPFDFHTKEAVSLTGKNIILVCCIAKPETLVSYLRSIANDVHPITYPDHHYFLSRDMEEIKAAYNNWNVQNKIIVTTEKDAARLNLQRNVLEKEQLKVAVLPIGISFLFDKGEEFDNEILSYVEATINENNQFNVVQES
jgi:tetraacyldisaccharide 4'-kinase